AGKGAPSDSRPRVAARDLAKRDRRSTLAPTFTKQPRLGPIDEERVVRRAPPPQQRVVLALRPTVEQDARRERVDVPRPLEAAAVLAVLAPVVQHVRERVPRLRRARDDLLVKAVREHVAPTTPRRAAARRPIDVLRGRDLKALHAARER